MADAPKTWNLDCPWCGFYIVAAMESGAGEKAASMMEEHLTKRHPEKTWKEFLMAGSDG